MPLLKRRPVAILPPPPLADVPQDAEVFYLKATGEIFLDYDAYSTRMTYLLQRIFQCEFSGKGNMDYFQAQESEQSESRVVRERFPDELKGRVLASVQFQVQGRLDVLVDLVYERYKDRYFPGEKVFVDLGGDKYFARISTVFPPANIRRAAQETFDELHSTPVASSSTSAPSVPLEFPKDPKEVFKFYKPFVHKMGTDLNVPSEQAKKDDDVEEYLYTVQLMDEEHKFEGSFMEVKGKALSRDRLAFSKSILKRYMRECVQRDPLIASPWIVKPAIARAFGIETSQTEEEGERNKKIREGKLAKRRKAGDGIDLAPPKKQRRAGETDSKAGTPQPDRKPVIEAKKAIKYPIEDLELDPMTIIDGRVLRRLNSELPALPPKPVPSREMVVPTEVFDRFLQVWNMINVFAKAIHISNFTLDDFADALNHQLSEPRCVLISEIHASLTNIIGTDTSRVLGSTGAPPLPVPVSTTASSSPAPEEDQLEYEENENDGLIRMGISYAKRWDRMAKLKSAEGREGWERHMIGALCQRGGPIAMPNFGRIMRHLLGPPGKSYLPPPAADEVPQSSQLTDIEQEPYDPEIQYLSLDIEDKVDILYYLVTLVLGSKPVRAYIEASESDLTEQRKARAEVNKERRTLIEQKAIMEGKPVKTEGAEGEEDDSRPVTLAVPTSAATNGASASKSNGNGAAARNGTPAAASVDDAESTNGRIPDSEPADEDEEDQLDDDSDIDEATLIPSLQPPTPQIGGDDSDDDASVASGPASVSGAGGNSRRAALETQRLERQAIEAARNSELAKARQEAKAKSAGRKAEDKARLDLEEAFKENGKKDDQTERAFRAAQGVARCRPLGKDRFFNRYWWFDGIGSMELLDSKSRAIVYGTGRLFVQGPSDDDWQMLVAERGEEAIKERMLREDVESEATLAVNEWAFYEEEEDIDLLQNWLNAKGIRELALKNAIAKWRGYILAGARKRQNDTSTPARQVDSRRSTRAKAEPYASKGYLSWRNAVPKM